MILRYSNSRWQGWKNIMCFINQCHFMPSAFWKSASQHSSEIQNISSVAFASMFRATEELRWWHANKTDNALEWQRDQTSFSLNKSLNKSWQFCMTQAIKTTGDTKKLSSILYRWAAISQQQLIGVQLCNQIIFLLLYVHFLAGTIGQCCYCKPKLKLSQDIFIYWHKAEIK